MEDALASKLLHGEGLVGLVLGCAYLLGKLVELAKLALDWRKNRQPAIRAADIVMKDHADQVKSIASSLVVVAEGIERMSLQLQRMQDTALLTKGGVDILLGEHAVTPATGGVQEKTRG